jgi:hypothetical protein
MSSEQFSEKPLPSAEKRCPHCGATMPAAAEMCWLCREKFSVQPGTPPQYGRSSEPPASEGQAKSLGDNAAWAVFGVLAIILCVALAFSAPGVLIVLLIVATPALIRTLVVGASQHDQPAQVSGPNLVQIFLSSIGIAAVVGVASFVAFFATCFVVCVGGLALNDLNHSRSYDWVVVASAGAGLVPGLLVAFSLFRYFWARKG